MFLLSLWGRREVEKGIRHGQMEQKSEAARSAVKDRRRGSRGEGELVFIIETV